MVSSNAALDVNGLAKRYGKISALNDLTLQVGRGEIFGFLGPNGAGKTTAVKMLVGLTRPTGGRGSVLGRPLGDRATRLRLGYLPELFRYQDWLSALEVLAFHARLARLASNETGSEIARVLALTGLTARGADRVGTFSKGMQQRLGIAVALLGKPDLIFLDEPTSALDPIGRHDVREILRREQARGATVFLNSHLLSEVELVCDRIAIVRRGDVVAQGTIAAIVGAGHAVRVRASCDGTPLNSILAAFGSVTTDGDAVRVDGVDEQRIPDIIGALIAANARVYEVRPLAATLEERFLAMTEGNVA
ncbi:MAG: ABC transporter ATP-binding protein [Candidatus Eremiobacteraeota bacterium]|nr:ABC transporter ATP-binding protein [Candidatus Eremiobacteraeota bacterium]